MNFSDCSYSNEDKKLRGYFQSEKYFIKYKNEVIKFFKTCLLRENVQNKINNILNKINTTNTISVHVRRNDYIHLQHDHYLQGETYYKNALINRYKLLTMPRRIGSAGAPSIRMIDLNQHATRHGISTPLVTSIETHLAKGNQILLFLNRRGFAPTLFCPGCHSESATYMGSRLPTSR